MKRMELMEFAYWAVLLRSSMEKEGAGEEVMVRTEQKTGRGRGWEIGGWKKRGQSVGWLKASGLRDRACKAVIMGYYCEIF